MHLGFTANLRSSGGYGGLCFCAKCRYFFDPAWMSGGVCCTCAGSILAEEISNSLADNPKESNIQMNTKRDTDRKVYALRAEELLRQRDAAAGADRERLEKALLELAAAGYEAGTEEPE